MSGTITSQALLMEAVVNGDEASFSRIYDQLAGATYSICQHHLLTPVAVDEAMRGLWLYIWQNAARLAALDGSPWATLIATAEHHAVFHANTEVLARADVDPAPTGPTTG